MGSRVKVWSKDESDFTYIILVIKITLNQIILIFFLGGKETKT